MKQSLIVLYAARRCTRSLAQHRQFLEPQGSIRQADNMTYNELLAKLQISYDVKRTSALRAVAELHKPEGNDLLQCSSDFRVYPCPTIQIIEKELR